MHGMDQSLIVLLACFLDAACGWPAWLTARIGHPVVWMGHGIAFLERKLNRPAFSFAGRRWLGGLSVLLLLAATIGISIAIARIGWWVELLGIGALLAQRSLYIHVRAVAQAASLVEARRCVAHIVGRDVAALDEAGVAGAAIESLAESFCDGVIAPLFWALLFGLPGIACYKLINTADSMIGHKDDRHRAFGWAAARADDAANWIPARLSGLLIVLASCSVNAWYTMRRDARKHASPNAGWPEAAMAGALGVRLGGARFYDGVEHIAPIIGDGLSPTNVHLGRALRIYATACLFAWAAIASSALISSVFSSTSAQPSSMRSMSAE